FSGNGRFFPRHSVKCRQLIAPTASTMKETFPMAPLPARLGLQDREERARKKQRRQKRKAAKLSRLHKPEGMALEAWQIELRRQFGRDQRFEIINVGDHPFFSEFEVTNPQNKNSYRVAIRGRQPGDNFCSCPDFTTNALGTCKHIEFTLSYLE